MRTEPRRRTAPGYSPESLSEYFAGLWDLRRTIEDRRRGETGSLRGEAEFRTEPSGLSYRENGALEIGAYRGRAHQGYLFLFPAPARLEVRFQDRRLFHRADLSSGMAETEHSCPPDLYRGRYLLEGPDAWQLTWSISGPRKDLILTSRYLRIGARD